MKKSSIKISSHYPPTSPFHSTYSQSSAYSCSSAYYRSDPQFYLSHNLSPFVPSDGTLSSHYVWSAFFWTRTGSLRHLFLHAVPYELCISAGKDSPQLESSLVWTAMMGTSQVILPNCNFWVLSTCLCFGYSFHAPYLPLDRPEKWDYPALPYRMFHWCSKAQFDSSI